MNDLNFKKTVYELSKQAKQKMKNDLFEEAFQLWEKASEIKPTESYYIQQQVLCKYKSKKPSELTSLTDALNLLNPLNPQQTNDLETLGLAGSIHKRLYHLTQDIEYLKESLKFYEKGFRLQKDYYNGENYAYCLNLMSKFHQEPEEKIYYKISAKKVRQEIIESLKSVEKTLKDSQDTSKDYKWELATLAKCYYAFDEKILSNKYENLFLEISEKWEKETYFENKEELNQLLKG